MKNRVIAVALLVAVGGSGTWNEPAHAQVQQGAEVVLRQTFNTSRVVYVETSDGYGVYEHADTRLFPVPKNVRVRISKLERSRNRLTVEYLHQTLGKGKIEADLREVGDQDEAVRQILWHAFSDPAEPDLYKSVVANRKTGVAHFAGSNHLPPAEDRSEYIDLDEALAAGHRRCGVCFYETPRSPTTSPSVPLVLNVPPRSVSTIRLSSINCSRKGSRPSATVRSRVGHF